LRPRRRQAEPLKFIASLEEPEVIAKIVAHREQTAPAQSQVELLPGVRAPPVPSQFSLL
jgi:hypothetical protein